MQAPKLATVSDDKFDSNEPVNGQKNEVTCIKLKKKN